MNSWTIQYKKDFCRIAPAFFTREDIEERNQHTVKLTNLPFGTTPVDLKEILQRVNAKTCFIPRTRNRYIRKRFAYISFASDEDLQKVMTNVRVEYNGIELHWNVEDAKTCHKCGSSEHLISKCDEKESANNYKEYKSQFSNIYSKYKVPNYKNLTKKSNDNKNSQQNSSNTFNNKSTNKVNDESQKMMENLIKSFMKDIEKKFDNIANQISDINNRIKMIEIKTDLDKPKPQPTSNKNNPLGYNMEYIPTQKLLEKSLLDKDNINKDEQNDGSSASSSNQINKRPLSESDNSSGDEIKNNSNKGKSVLHKPRRKSIRLSEKEDIDKTTNNKDDEINDIKATQLLLAKEMGDLKDTLQQFTVQWFNNTNLSQSGTGNSTIDTSQ